MGFWDGAVSALLRDGWKVEFIPVDQDRFPGLKKYRASVSHVTDTYPGEETPVFGEAYADDFAEALSGAIQSILDGEYHPDNRVSNG